VEDVDAESENIGYNGKQWDNKARNSEQLQEVKRHQHDKEYPCEKEEGKR